MEMSEARTQSTTQSATTTKSSPKISGSFSQGEGRRPAEAAFTLLEMIVVIGIAAFVYAVAIPNFALMSGTEVAGTLGQLSEDVRSAYDLTVLSGKAHRMVFRLQSGEYWLEETERRDFTIGDRLSGSDASPNEEKDRAEQFKDEFAKYEDLAGEAFKDPKSGDEIPKVSPVLKAKEALQAPTWTKVSTPEWQKRSIGEHIFFHDIQAEHHERPINMEDQGRDAVAMIYFLPNGYVEKAYMHIYYNKGDLSIDETKEPYTVVIDSYLGTADVRTGAEEINVHADPTST